VVLTFLTKILKSKTRVDAKLNSKTQSANMSLFFSSSKIPYGNKNAEFEANLNGKICNKNHTQKNFSTK
jgi:hypothetical protein